MPSPSPRRRPNRTALDQICYARPGGHAANTRTAGRRARRRGVAGNVRGVYSQSPLEHSGPIQPIARNRLLRVIADELASGAKTRWSSCSRRRGTAWPAWGRKPGANGRMMPRLSQNSPKRRRAVRDNPAALVFDVIQITNQYRVRPVDLAEPESVVAFSGDIVVVSYGAVNSAAPLLRSASDSNRDGLAKRSGDIARGCPIGSPWGCLQKGRACHRGRQRVRLIVYRRRFGTSPSETWRS
jgi:hypothetical protein